MKLIKSLVFIALISTVTVQAKENFMGVASYYADMFEGRLTANGEIYSHNGMTCAHKTLPFGTLLKVTNLSNDKSVIVTVNDRGPFIKGRVVDLTKSAARKIDMIHRGIVNVKVEIIDEDGNIFPLEEIPAD